MKIIIERIKNREKFSSSEREEDPDGKRANNFFKIVVYEANKIYENQSTIHI